MTSIKPAPESVHPDVSADVGDGELLELTDEEILRQLGEAGVDAPQEHETLEALPDERSPDESGSWVPVRESVSEVPISKPVGPSPERSAHPGAAAVGVAPEPSTKKADDS